MHQHPKHAKSTIQNSNSRTDDLKLPKVDKFSHFEENLKKVELKTEEKQNHVDLKFAPQEENTTNPNSNSDKDSVLKQIENMTARNYSDFMRSLASKYNQQ